MQEAAARPADRDSRDAGRLYLAVWRGCDLPERHCAVELDYGRRCAGGKCAETAIAAARGKLAAVGGADRAGWRNAGHDFVDSVYPAWAGTGVVRDVARRAAAEGVRQDTPAV